MRKFKSQMIEYKGGFCVRCGYKKYQGALEFHHLEPNEKDFNPSHIHLMRELKKNWINVY
jgi:hypothetical protein